MGRGKALWYMKPDTHTHEVPLLVKFIKTEVEWWLLGAGGGGLGLSISILMSPSFQFLDFYHGGKVFTITEL